MLPTHEAGSSQVPEASEVIFAEKEACNEHNAKNNIQVKAFMPLPQPWKLFWRLIFINVTVRLVAKEFYCHVTKRDNKYFLRTHNKKVIDYQEFINLTVIQRTSYSLFHQL